MCLLRGQFRTTFCFYIKADNVILLGQISTLFLRITILKGDEMIRAYIAWATWRNTWVRDVEGGEHKRHNTQATHEATKQVQATHEKRTTNQAVHRSCDSVRNVMNLLEGWLVIQCKLYIVIQFEEKEQKNIIINLLCLCYSSFLPLKILYVTDGFQSSSLSGIGLNRQGLLP